MRRYAAYCIGIFAALTAIAPSLWSQSSSECGPPGISVSVTPSPSIYGQSVTVNVNAGGDCGAAPGSVTLVVDNGSQGSAVQLDGNGNATIGIPDSVNGVPGPLTLFPSTGSHTVGVNYGENTSEPLYDSQAASTNQISTTVNKASTSTSLSAATNGTSLTAQVSVLSPGSGTPTGTVVFTNSGNTIGSAAVSGGQAVLNTSGVSGLITATYSGDTHFTGSASSPLQVVPPISPTSVLTLDSTLNTSTIGQAVTFTATLTVMNGDGPARGTVQFSDGATLLGSPVPVSLGQAIYTTSSLKVGNHNINASYSGDGQYPSAGASRGLVVGPVASVLTLSSSPAAPQTSQPVTLTAQIGPAPPSGVPGPTGQVTFTEGSTQLGVAAVSSGAATFQLANLAAGTHKIVAQYSGDADWAKAQSSITIGVAGGPLTITTLSPLPGATVGKAYTAPAMSASGGVPPYQWRITQTTPSESGIALDSNGAFSGTPATAGTFTLTVQVTDDQSTVVSKQFTLVVTTPLTITTQSLPDGAVGSPYSATVAATGGTPPYTFSGILAPGLTIAPASDPTTATISGTPITSGTMTITLTVTDSAGAIKSALYKVSFTLPAVPPLTISGSGNTGPGAQPNLLVSLGGNFPLPINGTLTLTFQADKGGDNPEVQFSAGGRTLSFIIPANTTAATFNIPNPQLQTGTVAGLITITADLQVTGTDITPAPAPTEQIRIGAAAPTISATAVHTATGFTVTVTGFSTTLDMTQAVFQFNAGSGANLQTASLTIPLGTLFSTFYQAAVPGSTGSQFVYVQPFNVNGGGSITSVTVTLANSAGTSQSATATIQ